jgi:hypothetical protein
VSHVQGNALSDEGDLSGVAPTRYGVKEFPQHGVQVGSPLKPEGESGACGMVTEAQGRSEDEKH